MKLKNILLLTVVLFGMLIALTGCGTMYYDPYPICYVPSPRVIIYEPSCIQPVIIMHPYHYGRR